MTTLQTKVNLLKALQESPLANTAMYKKQIATLKKLIKDQA